MRAANAAVVAQFAFVSFACRPGSSPCSAGYSILDEIGNHDTEDINWMLFDLMWQQHIDILDGPGPFTVLAPNTRSFIEAGICTDYSAASCSMPSDHLTDFLMYHIVEGNFTVADLREGQVLNTMFTGHQITVQSINGQSMTLRSGDGKETVFPGGGSECTNGVIHNSYNDNVLIPDPHWYCDCRVVFHDGCTHILDDESACYKNCCGEPHATFV